MTNPENNLKASVFFKKLNKMSVLWQDVHVQVIARIEKEGLTERAIILCKLNKSLIESSISVGMHRQKGLYYLMNLCI